VYGREYNHEILSFEPSGGLMQASLVMRDRETDSWWSIISGDAIGGNLEGTKLEELPVWEKTTWGSWRERHPNSLVLSVEGVEHESGNPYDRYFESEGTFRNTEVKDDRLPGKTMIYTFQDDGKAYAATHASIEGGATFTIDDGEIQLFRTPGGSIYESTRATITSGDGKEERMSGFDTYWYIWSNIHEGVVILESSEKE
jgi:hypothetical protein